jgi:hypothetical protein
MKRVIILNFILIVFFNINAKSYDIYGWGTNANGILGIGDTWAPKQSGTDTNWSKIESGDNYSIAIKNDGTLWAWGNNSYGQLGDGTIIERHSPTQIGTDKNWNQIDCGGSFTVAIKTDGTLWAWGNNNNGQLGDGTNSNRTTPIQIGNDSNWIQISCSYSHTLAIKNDGTLWAWGNNEYGQLGDGTITPRKSPVQIGSGTNWSKVACGFEHTIAMTKSTPIITTTSITNITETSASTGGNITVDGGASVTTRGVCWSTSHNPTISDSKTTDGNGTGSFSSTITCLTHVATYYVRAYATNSIGTAYGEEKIFTTPDFSIALNHGWNMISSNYLPNEPDQMESIFNFIIDKVIIVKNNNGETFIPQYGINDIGSWNITEGYQVYMTDDETLGIFGSIVNPAQTSINLNQGWNMISYLRNSELDCDTAFAGLSEGNLIIVKDNYGNVYIPEYGINTIGHLVPGQGYQIYVLNNDVLTYPGN